MITAPPRPSSALQLRSFVFSRVNINTKEHPPRHRKLSCPQVPCLPATYPSAAPGPRRAAASPCRRPRSTRPAPAPRAAPAAARPRTWPPRLSMTRPPGEAQRRLSEQRWSQRRTPFRAVQRAMHAVLGFARWRRAAALPQTRMRHHRCRCCAQLRQAPKAVAHPCYPQHG